MSAFRLADYSLILGDHDTSIWCRHCCAALYDPDGTYMSFNCDHRPLPISDLITAAQTHHETHHRDPH